MASDDYTSTPSTGKLKIKGVKDSKVTKTTKKIKKKKNVQQPEQELSVKRDKNDIATRARGGDGEEGGGSIVLREGVHDKDGDGDGSGSGQVGGEHITEPGLKGKGQGKDGKEESGVRSKTEAEKRYEDQRRRRLDERLRREGIKTHKERVEDLNRYLSGLSEHHDMPRIGPG